MRGVVALQEVYREAVGSVGKPQLRPARKAVRKAWGTMPPVLHQSEQPRGSAKATVQLSSDETVAQVFVTSHRMLWRPAAEPLPWDELAWEHALVRERRGKQFLHLEQHVPYVTWRELGLESPPRSGLMAFSRWATLCEEIDYLIAAWAVTRAMQTQLDGNVRKRQLADTLEGSDRVMAEGYFALMERDAVGALSSLYLTDQFLVIHDGRKFLKVPLDEVDLDRDSPWQGGAVVTITHRTSASDHAVMFLNLAAPQGWVVSECEGFLDSLERHLKH